MTALRTTATDRPEEPRMPTDDPMAAALARLHREHPDLPTDGGPVWEPVQDGGEQAVGPHQFVRFLTGPDATPRDTCHCGRGLFDAVHPDWPPLGPAEQQGARP